MTIRRASKDDLKGVAEDLFGMLVADLREELSDLRAQQTRLQDSMIATVARVAAVEHRLKNEFMRSQKSREAILKRLAEVENAARRVS